MTQCHYYSVGKDAEEAFRNEADAANGTVSIHVENGRKNGQKLYQHLERNTGMQLLQQQVHFTSTFSL